MFRRTIAFTLFIVLFLSGCATRTKMAFENDTDKWTDNHKPVYLLTATIDNGYKPSYQPKLLVTHVEKPDAKDSADRLNFIMDEKAKDETEKSGVANNYFLRLELDNGKYELVGLTSVASSFPVIAHFFTPVHAEIDVKAPGVYYLGNIRATVRERKNDEFKAGPSVPLIDQAAAGASGGTFDVAITDQFSRDEVLFRARFPALAGVKITKAILPPFDRKKAQSWWEAH